MSTVYEQYPQILDSTFVAHFDFTRCWTRENPDGPYEMMDVAIALIRTLGDLSETAHLLGRSRRSVHGYILRQTELRDLLEDVNDQFLDAIESSYKKDALAGDMTAKKFFLQSLAKDRGYTTRVENTGKDGGAIQVEEVNRDAESFASRMARLAAAGSDAGGADEADGKREGRIELDVARVVGSA